MPFCRIWLNGSYVEVACFAVHEKSSERSVLCSSIAELLMKRDGDSTSAAGNESATEISEVLKYLNRLEKQKETIELLNDKIVQYEQQLGIREVSDEYKDRLFKFLFGNPENREWTLALYNAVNKTSYEDADAIQFNTIGQFLYLKMRNDASFIIYFEMNLWEHQSTYNPNMPMRFLRYGARLYEKYIASSDYYEFSSKLQPVPRPVCVCFYNGTQEQPETKVLRLSDAYEGKGGIEVSVTMLNINYGKNRKLMEACKPLDEYAWFVSGIRKNQKNGMNLSDSVDAAVDSMPEDYVIKPFIVANRAEVRSMLFTEYNEDLVRKYDRKEAREEGIKEGREEGIKEGREEGIKEGREEGIDFINALNCKLLELGRMEDLIKSSKDKEYQRQLLHEFFPDVFHSLKTE